MVSFFLQQERIGCFNKLTGFCLKKHEGREVFEIQLDEDFMLTTIATSIGWRGEPGLEQEEAVAYLMEKTEQGPVELNFVGVSILWDELGGKEVEQQTRSCRFAEVLTEVIEQGIDGFSGDWPDDMEVCSAEHVTEKGEEYVLLHCSHDHTVRLKVVF